MFHLGIELLHLLVLSSNTLETVRAPRRCSYSSEGVSCFDLVSCYLRRWRVPPQKQSRSLTRLAEPGCIPRIRAGTHCSFVDARPVASPAALPRSTVMNRIRRTHAGMHCSSADGQPAAPVAALTRSTVMNRIRRNHAGKRYSFADEQPVAPASALHRSS